MPVPIWDTQGCLRGRREGDHSGCHVLRAFCTWAHAEHRPHPGHSGAQGFLVAQMVKNLPALQVTQVRSLEDPLEKGMATHSGILAWGNPMDRGA